nr:hypothetical protein [Tanacetum cinerariifolium]
MPSFNSIVQAFTSLGHDLGCALLRRELEENLVTHSSDLQNTSEPSNASTNVVNAPRDPYVVKQDNESFVYKIIFDLNKAPDSPHLHTISSNQFRCFHCKDVLRDGEACKRCTCANCGSDLGKGLCYICGHNQNSLNDSPNSIFCKRCTCMSCGKDAHIGYNCSPTVPSSSTSLNSLLEETNTSDNSLPEFETFCIDVEEISSGSTTTYPDLSLPEYEVFYDDHVKEISSGSPATHSDSSLYASFIFDLSINPFPPADKSDFYEFTDELIPFISPPEYDCFLFKVEPNSGDFTKDVVKDISPTKEPQVLNALPTHPSLQLNMKFQPSSKSLFTYVVWIFLPFLVYSVAPHYLLSLRNEDTIFDPGICNSHFSRPDVPHRCGTVKKFNTHRSHLNKCPMIIHGQNNPILDVLLFYFYPP